MVVSTGVKGLDKILGGGFPDKEVILVTGGPGTGKSILGLQYIAEGLKKGERCMYVSFEENRDIVLRQANQMGWNFEKYEAKGLLKMMNYNLSKKHVVDVILEIEREAKRFKPNRLTIDSLSVLSLYAEIAAGAEIARTMRIPKEINYSKEVITIGAIMGLMTRLKMMDATVLVVTELPEGAVGLTRDTFSEFLSDGIIKLERDIRTGKRYLIVLKMRLANADVKPHQFRITDNGIKLVR